MFINMYHTELPASNNEHKTIGKLKRYVLQCHLACRRRNAYDGVQEYWVTVRESGERTTETSYEEHHQKTAKAPPLNHWWL